MDDIVLRPCVVCGVPVECDAHSTEDALCIEDYFADDPTAEWEREDVEEGVG